MSDFDLGRNVICAPNIFQAVKLRGWKNRKIEQSVYAMHDQFFYKGANGRIRTVDLRKKTICEHIFEYCEILKSDYPTMYMRVVRRFK